MKVAVFSPKKLLSNVLDQVQSIDLLNQFTPNTDFIENDGVFRIYDVIQIGFNTNYFDQETTFPYPG